jgi:hypothetical protein
MSVAALTPEAPPETPTRSLRGLEAAAAYLALEPDELSAWLDHGGTLPVLARALGRSADDAVAIVLAHAPPHEEAWELRRRLVDGEWHPRATASAARLAA